MSDTIIKTAGGAEGTVGPWRQALRKLAQDRVAMGAALVLLLIVLACTGTPLYARLVARTDPFASSLDSQITLHGKAVPVMQPSPTGLGMTPIAPPGGRNIFLAPIIKGGMSRRASFMAGATRC
jgi:hypothetical protein